MKKMHVCKKAMAFSLSGAMLFSVAALPASAAEAVEIPYAGTTEGAYRISDDGSSIRLNILNTWTSPQISDIEAATACSEYIEVTFTIAGIGENYCNMNEDGTEGEAYNAQLMGAIGGMGFWGNEDDTATIIPTAITGDGTYTVRTELPEASDAILCLILETNINVYQYNESGSLADSGVTITVDGVRTGAPYEFVFGDPNKDGAVTVEDAVMVLSYYAQQSAGLDMSTVTDYDNADILSGDINGNELIEVEDAVKILTYYAQQSAGLAPSWDAV